MMSAAVGSTGPRAAIQCRVACPQAPQMVWPRVGALAGACVRVRARVDRGVTIRVYLAWGWESRAGTNVRAAQGWHDCRLRMASAPRCSSRVWVCMISYRAWTAKCEKLGPPTREGHAQIHPPNRAGGPKPACLRIPCGQTHVCLPAALIPPHLSSSPPISDTRIGQNLARLGHRSHIHLYPYPCGLHCTGPLLANSCPL
jgi:hypothetical protein